MLLNHSFLSTNLTFVFPFRINVILINIWLYFTLKIDFLYCIWMYFSSCLPKKHSKCKFMSTKTNTYGSVPRIQRWVHGTERRNINWLILSTFSFWWFYDWHQICSVSKKSALNRYYQAYYQQNWFGTHDCNVLLSMVIVCLWIYISQDVIGNFGNTDCLWTINTWNFRLNADELSYFSHRVKFWGYWYHSLLLIRLCAHHLTHNFHCKGHNSHRSVWFLTGSVITIRV